VEVSCFEGTGLEDMIGGRGGWVGQRSDGEQASTDNGG
jgi:hypothetical protein